MARGRIISRNLGSSRKFAWLGRCPQIGEFGQALYPLLVVHADDYGREEGDAFTVKTRVFPASTRPEEDFEAALEAMVKVGLIERYAVNGSTVIQIVAFGNHQGLKARQSSSFPDRSSSTEDGVPRTDLDLDHDLETKRNETNCALRARFEQFWNCYPRKIGKDAAWKEWLKRSPGNDLSDQMIAAVERHKASPQWRKEAGQFIPHPRTWLHQGRWQDEPDVEKPGEKPYVSWRDRCQHDPPCHSPVWHDALEHKERKEGRK
jgi:hypothetical protein